MGILYSVLPKFFQVEVKIKIIKEKSKSKPPDYYLKQS